MGRTETVKASQIPAANTILCLAGPYASTCGYCGKEPGMRSPSRSSYTYGVYPFADDLECSVYMDMIDRGWRRSGTYLYKPDMRRTCCPQYTIRLDALVFSPSRSQRQVTNRWTRYILEGDQQDSSSSTDITADTSNKQKKTPHPRSQGKQTSKAPPFDLVTAIHSPEAHFALEDSGAKPAHRLEVTLEPSIFTKEKFALYKSYQREIHHEQDEKSPDSFFGFLVESPLLSAPIPYPGPDPPPSHLPKMYGSYHQCYRVDGVLVAMAVLDILPGCVSSVYFMYNKRWERFSLGKVSAVREAALAREIHDAGVSSMQSLYMGFYVHSCPKMRYKGDYKPSYLLDPEEYTWHLLDECLPILAEHRYGCFAHPEHSLDGDPGPVEVGEIPAELLSRVNILDEWGRTPLSESSRLQDPAAKDVVSAGVIALGAKVAQEVTLDI